jgi:hypothetical protein
LRSTFSAAPCPFRAAACAGHEVAVFASYVQSTRVSFASLFATEATTRLTLVANIETPLLTI